MTPPPFHCQYEIEISELNMGRFALWIQHITVQCRPINVLCSNVFYEISIHIDCMMLI